MAHVVRAFPIRRPIAEVQAFAAALSGERRAETDRFYSHYGVSHESWHLQETPQGPWLIGVTVLDDPEDAGKRYSDASEEFHA